MSNEQLDQWDYHEPVEEKHTCSCANCGWQGEIDDTEPYRDFWSRVQPGEIIPAGDCPECGAFCYVDRIL